jgi:putative membrane protein insertion efficiency factor
MTPSQLLAGTFRAYKRVVSPLLPQACRFHPTCSEYAAQAVEIHGAIKGSALAAQRLMRCHPWNAGGFDPVPTATVAPTLPRA